MPETPAKSWGFSDESDPCTLTPSGPKGLLLGAPLSSQLGDIQFTGLKSGKAGHAVGGSRPYTGLVSSIMRTHGQQWLLSVTFSKWKPRSGGRAGWLSQDGPWFSSVSPQGRKNQPDQNQGKSWGRERVVFCGERAPVQEWGKGAGQPTAPQAPHFTPWEDKAEWSGREKIQAPLCRGRGPAGLSQECPSLCHALLYLGLICTSAKPRTMPLGLRHSHSVRPRTERRMSQDCPDCLEPWRGA